MKKLLISFILQRRLFSLIIEISAAFGVYEGIARVNNDISAGLTEGGLPLGLQIVGNYFKEKTILNVAKVIETFAEFNEKPDFWWK